MRLAVTAATLLALGFAAPAQAAAPKEEGGGKAAERKVSQSESWVEMQDFYTTIVGADRATGMLMVRVGLDIPDAKMRENATRAMPVLRDAYLRSLMAFTATHVRLDTQPDAVAIADRLQIVTDRALKKKGARILLRQVALRAK